MDETGYFYSIIFADVEIIKQSLIDKSGLQCLNVSALMEVLLNH